MINIPRLTIAALRGGAGKTFITLGIAAALKRKGLALSIFKKGPDYIDSGWLGKAVDGECRNLDSYLSPPEKVKQSFFINSSGKDLALIEGNRGLYDGVDVAGAFSTAELAKLLGTPVVLIVDATKMTRTAAAMVLGCSLLDTEVNIQAVILNRVAGARHDRILRESIESATSIPVVGSIAKLTMDNFPQRHLGLLPLFEHTAAERFLLEAANIIESSVDLDKLQAISASASPTSVKHSELMPSGKYDVTVGILKDSAFQFYYPENLEALTRLGAKLIILNSLTGESLPELDALYIGGGFPETHAHGLAENKHLRDSILRAAKSGLPIYAECGGLMYLSRSLQIDENTYPMVGLFPIDTILERKPQGHGYIHVDVTRENPFYPVGSRIIGHEFHYSYVTGLNDPAAEYVFEVKRGHGMDGVLEGIAAYNALGTYLHVLALGSPLWAQGIVQRAAEFAKWKRVQDR